MTLAELSAGEIFAGVTADAGGAGDQRHRPLQRDAIAIVERLGLSAHDGR